MDDLAERANQDPVAYRLSVLSDPRARACIERVAQMSDWRPGEPAGTGHGRGIGFARYKNMAGYAAVVAEPRGTRPFAIRSSLLLSVSGYMAVIGCDGRRSSGTHYASVDGACGAPTLRNSRASGVVIRSATMIVRNASAYAIVDASR